MTRMTINKNLKKFFGTISAKDGYAVEFVGETYRDEMTSLDMLLHDYEGYEVEEVNQEHGRKERLCFLLIDKD